MKKTISIVLVLVLGLVSVSPATDGIWTTKADMPTRRYVPSTGVVDGKIYVIGGAAANRGLSTVEAYDPATDTWTRKAAMPMINAAAATSVVNGRIYVIGGKESLWGATYSSVIVYDAATDTWTAKTNMPTGRAWVSSSVVNGKIYVIGGAVISYGAPLSTVEEYDPATDTWTRKADMPTARSCLSTNAVNGKIYAIGGTLSDPYYRGLSTVEEYDPATDTWTRKTDMPTGRTYISTCAVNGKIYAIGGVKSGGADHVSQVEEYDPATDTWTTKADIPTARSGVATSAVNGKIYAIGGWVGTGSPISTVEEYDPPKPLIIDFNGDQKVDFKDFSMLAQYWYEDQSPFVSHRLHYKDLAVLAECWLEDFRLLAHWKLDETEGSIAHDSIGSNDGTIHGEPVWQPVAGKIDGALRFHGTADYVSADSPLAFTDFSWTASAWIKGGAPGEAIISQTGGTMPGATWLGTDPSDGKLITTLLGPFFPPLESDAVITDEQWHRIGLVYDFDSFHRRLYVDGAEVAKDTDIVAGLLPDGDLYFGVGKDLDAASFFSGLIDDVRIYNQALSTGEIEELAR